MVSINFYEKFKFLKNIFLFVKNFSYKLKTSHVTNDNKFFFWN